MKAMSFSSVRNNFKDVCDEIYKNLESIIITRKNNENVVIISEAEYNNLIENAYVRSSKANYDHLMKSIEEANEGKLHEVKIDE